MAGENDINDRPDHRRAGLRGSLYLTVHAKRARDVLKWDLN
jgi:hypothetical protein